MKYNQAAAIEILEKTPTVLRTLLSGLDKEWIMQNEGPDTFSPYDVVGHLVHGEKADWTERIKRIRESGESKAFDVFDRFAMYEDSRGKSLDQILDEFEALRIRNIQWFKSLKLDEKDLELKGKHPALGQVTLRQLLSTWVIHDLTHIAQVTRVMAKQLKGEMGPWLEYFRIMNF
jgi:hypothetical protein